MLYYIFLYRETAVSVGSIPADGTAGSKKHAFYILADIAIVLHGIYVTFHHPAT